MVMFTPIITEIRPSVYEGSIHADGWSLSAQFGSYMAARDWVDHMRAELELDAELSRPIPSRDDLAEFDAIERILRENRAAGF